MSSTEDRLKQLLDEARLKQEALALQEPPEAQPSLDELKLRAEQMATAEQTASNITGSPSPYAPGADLGTFQAGAATFGNNIQQRLLGGSNTLLMGLEKAGIRLPPNPFNPALSNPEAAIEDNRRRARALQDINDALHEQEPFGSKHRFAC